MYRVNITAPAKQDVRRNHDWWAKNRSTGQAARWYRGVIAKMYSLTDTADRYAFATEDALRRAHIKQASFGLGPRPTHRILFGIRGDEVVIYRVRALAQDAIGVEDLGNE